MLKKIILCRIMKASFQVVHLAVFVIGFVRAITDDNHDVVATEDQSPYSDLAEQLNCTEFVVRHSGVKTEEEETDSIYRAPLIQDSDDDTVLLISDEETVTEALVPENESAEKPSIVSDDNDKKTRAKRGAVIIERLWTAKNISIVDGYSKVAFYPPKPEEQLSTMKENVRAKRMAPPENETEEECTAPFDDDGLEYNWYQVIVNNGGPPGEVNATLLNPNATEVLEPCYRPISNTSPPFEDLLYDFELLQFENVYRHERAFLRFAKTPSEFVDIVGQLVWSPPKFSRRYYGISYRKDDTGFYVNIHRRQYCTFKENPLSVKCEQVSEDDYTPCDVEFSLSAGLQASLIG